MGSSPSQPISSGTTNQRNSSGTSSNRNHGNNSCSEDPDHRPAKRTRTSNNIHQDRNPQHPNSSNDINSDISDEPPMRPFRNRRRNNNTHEESADDLEVLQHDLEEVEWGLNENHGIVYRSTHRSEGSHHRSGRALFESIGSALENIRERLHSLTNSSSSSNNNNTGRAENASAETETSSATTSTSTQRPTLSQDESLRALSQRLDTAQLSHSTRMPLNLLQTALSRRDLADEPTTPNGAAAAAASAASSLVTSIPSPDGSTVRVESFDSSSSIEVAYTGSTRPTLQRRSSALLASRNRDDGSVGGGGSSPATIPSSTSSSPLPNLSEISFTSGRNLLSSVRTSLPTLRERPSIEEDGIEVSIEMTLEADDGIGLLLPDSARKHKDRRPSMRKSLSILGDDIVRQLADVDEETVDIPKDEDAEDAEDAEDPTPITKTAVVEMYTWGTLQFSDSAEEEKDDTTENVSYQLFGTSDDAKTGDTTQLLPPESRLGRADVVSMSASETHCAFVTASGRLLICGNNRTGAVDPSRRDAPQIPRPTHLETGLGNHRIKKVSCGIDHTAVVTETKSVLTWGSNSRGQLGHRNAKRSIAGNFVFPKAFILSGGRRADNVACCDGYTVVLTTRMEAFVCGGETIEGGGPDDDGFFPMPKQNSVLQGLPLVGVASGIRHMVVWTAHGTAYAWGCNKAGQCGREFPHELKIPVPIGVPKSTLSPVSSQNSSSNLENSMATTPFLKNWRVWESGEPMSLASDVHIVDAACGNHHTILIADSGRLLVCGSNTNRQLGIDTKSDAEPALPMPTKVQAVAHPNPERQFQCVEAGAKHTLLLDDNGSVWQMGNDEPSIRQVSFMPQSGSEICSIMAGGLVNFAVSKSKGDQTTCATAPSMPELDDLMNAIRLEHDQKKESSTESSSSEQVGETKNYLSSIEDLARGTENLFRSPAVMNSLFVDPNEIDHMYQTLINGSPNSEMKQKIVSSIERGMLMGLKSMADSRLIYFESVRFLLLYLQCPLWRDEVSKKENEKEEEESQVKFDKRGDLLFLLCETILALPFEGYKAFLAWSSLVYGEKLFVPLLIKPLVHQLNYRFMNNITHGVPMIAGVLRWLHTVNERSDGVLSRGEDFYCSGIDDMSMEALFEDLAKYHMASDRERSRNFFLAAYPFLMAPTVKQKLLQVESQMSMVEAAQADGVSFDAQTREFKFQPYFVLAIDRKHLLTQTLQKVAKASTTELRKGLKVVFKGEDGVDAGGVTKEFFQLLCEQLFDVNTGMWTTSFGNNDETWFNSDCTWNADGFYLVGVLCGLAVYNSVILDVHFPHALYRKLLGLPLGLEDLIDQDVRKGLESLLDYDGDDVEFIFCLNFEVSWMYLGQERKRELKPGGSDIAVTSENKEEYVMLYVKWILVDSIASQYDEFEKGFNQVMKDSSLNILLADELELLVTGTPELDFLALEQTADYEGGYDKDSAVVRNIWKWIKSASLPTQEKFLKFCTGSSKGPIGGLGNMPFKIQRAGPDSPQLPTAHTCFNTLIIPDYGEDYEKLSDRLGRAVIECEGFGLQ